MLKQAAGNLDHRIRSNPDPGFRGVCWALAILRKDFQTIATHGCMPERHEARVGTRHELSPPLARRCLSSIAHHGRPRLCARWGRGRVPEGKALWEALGGSPGPAPRSLPRPLPVAAYSLQNGRL